MSDFRDAVRALRGTPGVSAIAILSLALGIGANSAIFSIVNSLLLRSLPVEAPQQLAIVTTADENDSWTYPIWEQIDARRDLFAGAAGWSTQNFNTSPGGESRFVDGLMVSGRFFDTLGVRAVLGRTLSPEDDRRGTPGGPAAVISYDYWQTGFAGRSDAIGQPLVLDHVTFTIVGVIAPEFFGPQVGSRFQVAVPFAAEPLLTGARSFLDNRSAWWVSILIRRRPDQSESAATALLRGVQPQIREATIPLRYREADKTQYLKDPFVLQPAANGVSFLRSRYQRPLLTIMVVVGLVLLIACANVANLLLARASARRHEMSVRLALGASRWRLARQLLAESAVLSGVSAALGLAFAAWGSRLLVSQLSTRTNTVFLDLGLDWRVVGFTTLVAAGTALLFGTAPALRAAGAQPNDALKEQGRGVHGQGRLAAGNLLVVSQVALSLVLVVAAGLFVRTFTQLTTRPLGFERDKVLVVSAVAQGNPSPEGSRLLFERLRQAAAAVPGVESAALSSVTPIGGMRWQERIDSPELAGVPERERTVAVNAVSPGFFRTFGTRLRAGRDFADTDTASSGGVAIVNEAFARKFFGGASVLGRRVRNSPPPGEPVVEVEIVGTVEDAVYSSVREPAPATLYRPVAQMKDAGPFSTRINVSARAAAGSPALLIRPVAEALTRVTPDVTLTLRPLSEQVGNSLARERLVAMLSGFFGALALLLAAIGLYGITSYAVARRRTEIGIRMAMGAAPAGVIRLILRRVALLVAVGVIAGATIALWASRFVETLLFGLAPRDPLTLAGSAVLLVAIGTIAGSLPAWRASRIDPARVLRE